MGQDLGAISKVGRGEADGNDPAVTFGIRFPCMDGNRAFFHVLSATAAPTCSPGTTAVCLGARFKVQVSGPGITGTAIPDTADTGDFWFYSPNNVDVVVKVLDGRAFNNKFWVFVSSLSNVGYTVTVTDTATGAVKAYTNPPGTVGSIADTTAF